MAARLSLFLLCLLWRGVFAGETQNLISGRFSTEELGRHLIPRNQWVPFPQISDRAGWGQADPEMMKSYVKKAEGYLDYAWPGIPATKSLLIERTGDRNEYQAISFKKREVLGTLLLAEIAENQGRFVDPIIDGVWSICEESFWGVPATLPKTKEFSGLADAADPYVDLCAAETASFLAWVDYFLGEKLAAVSPQIRKRIRDETTRRIFVPLATKPHRFMGPDPDGRPPNNWNPWICSNWLTAVLLLETDHSKRAATVARILGILDQFLNPCPADGGCDEGSTYWGVSAGSLYDNLALLNLATGNSFSYVYRDERFRNMGRFIYRAQISPACFVNFGDASPKPELAASLLYRFGKDIQDDAMKKFGAYYGSRAEELSGRSHYLRSLFALFVQPEYQKAAQGLPLPRETWLPDLQVMMARDKAGSTDGFFVAAKGGNNGGSHSHNDIGNYVVYYNGSPLIIDVGSGTYTRRTFSSKRYEIWSNRSEYHNVPTINGRNQLHGAAYKATLVSCQTTDDLATFELDLARAYPKETAVGSWTRTIHLNRRQDVVIADAIELTANSPLVQHVMTCYPAEVIAAGTLVIHYAPEGDSARDFAIAYDPAQFEVAIEKTKLETREDRGIRKNWGDTIHRINFTAKAPMRSGTYRLRISPR